MKHLKHMSTPRVADNDEELPGKIEELVEVLSKNNDESG